MLMTELSNKVAGCRQSYKPGVSRLSKRLLVLILCLGVLPLMVGAAEDPGLPDSVLIGFKNYDSTIECNHPDRYNQSVTIWWKTDTSIAATEFHLEIVSVDGGEAVVRGFYHWGLDGNLPNAEVEWDSDGQLPDTVIVRRYALNAEEEITNVDDGPGQQEPHYEYPHHQTKILFDCISLGKIQIRNLDNKTRFWSGGCDPFGDEYYCPAFPPYTVELVEIESPIIDDPGNPDSVVIEANDIVVGESTPIPIWIYNDEPLDAVRMRLGVTVDTRPDLVQFDSVSYSLSTQYLRDRYTRYYNYLKTDYIDTLLITADHEWTQGGSPIPAFHNQPVAVAWFTGVAPGEVRIEATSWAEPKFYGDHSSRRYWVPKLIPAHMPVVPFDPGGSGGDIGAPDTLRIEAGTVVLGQSCPISVSLFNDEPIANFTFPFEINALDQGRVRFDSLRWVGRLTNPMVSQMRSWSEVAAGRVLAFGYDINDLPIASGDGPVAQLFFTGIVEGEVSIDTYSTSSYDCSLKPPGGERFNPEIIPAVIQVEPPLPPAPLFEPVLTDQLVVVAGTPMAFEIDASSPVGNPVYLSLTSLNSPDIPGHLPLAVPEFTDGQPGQFWWNPDSADVGIWEAAFEAVDGVTGLSNSLAVCLQVVSGQEYLASFELGPSLEAQHATGLVHGDFDHDNRPEVLMSSVSWGTGKSLGVYDFTPSDGLEEVFAIYENFPNAGIATGYFDGDAHLDAVSCLFDRLWVFTGNGDNTFTVHDISEPTPIGNVQNACFTDYNGDAYLDYAVATTTGISIYTLDPATVFTQAIQFEAGGVPMSVNSADFDRDGWDDLAVGTGQGLEIYLNDHQGGYSLAHFYAQPFGSVDIDVTSQGSDFNGDGFYDLSLASPSFGELTSELMVYFGSGDGSFAQELVRTLRGNVHVTRIRDINNDGHLDIAFLNNTERYVSVLFGDGAGHFHDEMRFDIPELAPCQLDCMDIDADGDVDLVVVAIQSLFDDFTSKLYLFRNELNPEDRTARSVQITVLDNADLEIIAPDNARLSTIKNGIISGEMYRCNIDNDAYMDASVSVSNVETGRYDLVVTPRPGSVEQTFSLEYSLDGEPYRIARDLPMYNLGYAFPIYPDGNSPIRPVQGQIIFDARPEFLWDTTAFIDIQRQSSLPMADERNGFRVSSDPTFEEIIESAVVARTSYHLATELNATDTTTYFWQVRPESEDDWGPVYAFHLVPGSSSAEEDPPAASLLPETYSLEQNYPNPFNPVTLMEFGLPVASQVRLDVFNILGQRVTTLVNGWLPAGYHSENWNATGQASGIYLYRLRAGDYVETRKMLLLK